jgi:hypothetical protein
MKYLWKLKFFPNRKEKLQPTVTSNKFKKWTSKYQQVKLTSISDLLFWKKNLKNLKKTFHLTSKTGFKNNCFSRAQGHIWSWSGTPLMPTFRKESKKATSKVISVSNIRSSNTKKDKLPQILCLSTKSISKTWDSSKFLAFPTLSSALTS